MICDNIRSITEKIKEAAEKSGRGPDEVKIICVTKGRAMKEIKEAINCGIADIGENRVQEAKEKYYRLTGKRVSGLTGKPANPQTRKPVCWHMIGHLQTNKVKDAVRIFDLVHSVDSERLVREIDREAAKIDKIQDVLIEVNTSGEASKFGTKPEGVMDLIEEAAVLKNIKISGLMTMAPIMKNSEEARPYFRRLRELMDEVNGVVFLDRRDILVPPDGGVRKPRLSRFYGTLSTLSMGMSQDYEVAVEEGATMVRIGTAIFSS